MVYNKHESDKSGVRYGLSGNMLISSWHNLVNHLPYLYSGVQLIVSPEYRYIINHLTCVQLFLQILTTLTKTLEQSQVLII